MGGDTDEESSEEGDVCGAEWGCELNGAGDEDDAGVCSHVKLSATRRSEAEIGFRANPQPLSEEVQGSHDRRAWGGKHMAGGGREETSHVSISTASTPDSQTEG